MVLSRLEKKAIKKSDCEHVLLVLFEAEADDPIDLIITKTCSNGGMH